MNPCDPTQNPDLNPTQPDKYIPAEDAVKFRSGLHPVGERTLARGSRS